MTDPTPTCRVINKSVACLFMLDSNQKASAHSHFYNGHRGQKDNGSPLQLTSFLHIKFTPTLGSLILRYNHTTFAHQSHQAAKLMLRLKMSSSCASPKHFPLYWKERNL